MPDSPASPRITWDKIVSIGLAAVGAIAILRGSVRDEGKRDSDIAENTRRIDLVEADVRDVKTSLYRIDGRTIRIETTMQMTAPAKEGERP